MCTLVEVPLYVSAIIFAAVFDRECLCPRDWQWQVGIAAVFLVWVDLILYMRRMRVLGKPSMCHLFHVYCTSIWEREGLCMGSTLIRLRLEVVIGPTISFTKIFQG